MTDETTELFIMVGKPKGKADSAIQLTQDIWKIEQELDMIFNGPEGGYTSYKEEGLSKILLKSDGTLILSFPTEKECTEKFDLIKKKMAASQTLSQISYEKLELATYKISQKVEGKLHQIAPKALIDFLCNPQQKVSYDPERIFLEFLDSKAHKNFVRITFDRCRETDKLLLDVIVESNDVDYAKATIKTVQEILKK